MVLMWQLRELIPVLQIWPLRRICWRRFLERLWNRLYSRVLRPHNHLCDIIGRLAWRSKNGSLRFQSLKWGICFCDSFSALISVMKMLYWDRKKEGSNLKLALRSERDVFKEKGITCSLFLLPKKCDVLNPTNHGTVFSSSSEISLLNQGLLTAPAKWTIYDEVKWNREIIPRSNKCCTSWKTLLSHTQRVQCVFLLHVLPRCRA